MMDSAVVRTDLDPGLRFRAVRPAPIIGYKPVRLITERNEIVANVIEHTGQLLGTIPVSKAPEEPLTPVLVLLNRFLEEGDSGCLIVDCEHEQPDGGRATPYAMYLGALNLNIGRAGYGQLLEQTRLHWGLEFCEPWEDDDERKPRIGY